MLMETSAIVDRWRVVGRWLQYEGELRVAVMRVALVATCYAAQLLHFFWLAERTDAAQQFHRQATYLAAAWLFVSLAVLVVLTRHWLPTWLKYVAHSVDVALLTLLAALGSGPQSPLVSFYFVLIALAALRGHLPLIWYGTLSAMVCYELLVGLKDPVWFDAAHTTPPIEQIMMQICLAATGIAIGQLIRMQRHAADAFLSGGTKRTEIQS